MTALQNGSYCDAHLLRQELTSRSPCSESESGLLQPQKQRHSSGDSFDSAFENEYTQEKRVTFVKARSFSECVDHSPTIRKGILKRVSELRVRCYSESSAETYQARNENGGYYPQVGSMDDEDDQGRDPDSDEIDSDKVKKTVRFSDTVHRQLFRTNSSILGQRKKNQRKQRNKKRKEELSSSTESVDQLTDSIEQLIIDSGTEVDAEMDNYDSGETPTPTLPQPSKKNKKNKRGRSRRKPAESDLIFDLDM